jgi:hypothetical protein
MTNNSEKVPLVIWEKQKHSSGRRGFKFGPRVIFARVFHKICFNIICPSQSHFLKLHHCNRFPSKNSVCILPLITPCYMSNISLIFTTQTTCSKIKVRYCLMSYRFTFYDITVTVKPLLSNT